MLIVFFDDVHEDIVLDRGIVASVMPEGIAEGAGEKKAVGPTGGALADNTG